MSIEGSEGIPVERGTVDRRTFLRGAAVMPIVLSLGGSSWTESSGRDSIESYDVIVVKNPEPLKGGKQFIFLKLTTKDGVVGYGEASILLDNVNIAVELFREMGDSFVVGSNPFDVEKLFYAGYKSGYGRQHPDLTRLPVLSAFEIACWDIIGKITGQPIYNLMGGKFHERLRTYTYMFHYTTGLGFSLEDAFNDATLYKEWGFTAIGVDPAGPFTDRPRSLSLEALREAEDAIRVIREAVGDSCDIILKTHGQMTTHSAIRLAKRLEQFDPLWYEEPVPPENVKAMAQVARSTSIPIATGERLTTKFEFREILDEEAAHILNPAVGRVGGLLEAKKIASMAEAYYVQIAPWYSTGPIAGAAAVQLDVCSPNFLIQECIERWDGFHAELLTEPIKWEEGYLVPPTGPGLGVELNEEFARGHAVLSYSSRRGTVETF